jgi:hypothetical protein
MREDMDRGSSKHSPRVDDELAGEVRGTVQGVAGARAEEWKMAEPSGEDQPQTTLVPDDDYGLGEPAGVGNPDAEEFSRFGSYLGRAFPGDRDKLAASARNLDAPDDVLAALASLPPDTEYITTAEVWKALGR